MPRIAQIPIWNGSAFRPQTVDLDDVADQRIRAALRQGGGGGGGSQNAYQVAYPNYENTVGGALDGLLNLVPAETLTNAVAGATLAAPALSAPWTPVAVNYTAPGNIELPLLSTVSKNFAYLFYRGAAGTTGLVEVIPSGTDLIDGRGISGNALNGGAFLSLRSSTATPLIVRASEGSWVTSGGHIASPNDTFAADGVLSLWSGHRYVSINGAAPVAVTLPVVVNAAAQGVPRGSKLTAWATSAGPHRISSGAGATIWGSCNGVNYSGAAFVPLVAGQTVHVEAFSSLVWLVH